MSSIQGADIMAKTVKLLTADGAKEFMRRIAPSFEFKNVTDDDLTYLDEDWQAETLYSGVHTVIYPMDSFLFWAAGDAIEVTEKTFPLLVEAYNEILPSFLAAKITDEQEYRVHDAAVTESVREYRASHEDSIEGWVRPRGPEPKAPVYAGLVAELFTSKVMRTRPQGAAYRYIPEDLWDLFDATGPVREVGFGNPYAPGEYKGPRRASDVVV